MKSNLIVVLLFALFAATIASEYTTDVRHMIVDLTGAPLVPAKNGSECTSNYTCASEGDDCKPASSCSPTDSSCCAAGLTCYNSTCMTDTIGEWCSKSSDCFTDYVDVSTACQNNTCVLQYYTNDECDDDNDCSAGSCVDGLCQGLPYNSTCTFGPQCAYGLSCFSNKCSNVSSAGNKCASDVNCEFGFSCATNGTCIDAYSLGAGEKCSTTSKTNCQDGLICTSGTCQSGEEWSTQDCDLTSDCPSGQSCFCSLYSGEQQCYPNTESNFTNYDDGREDLFDCIRENHCTHLSNAPDSCTAQNCGGDVDDSFDYSCDLGDSVLDDCNASSECGGFPTWAIIVIAVVAVILVLVIIVVAVMCMKKKRNDYDSI